MNDYLLSYQLMERILARQTNVSLKSSYPSFIDMIIDKINYINNHDINGTTGKSA